MSLEVWVVDDDDSIRWVLEKALGAAGMAVSSFPGGVEMLDALETGCPDVVVTDIRMRGIDGIELARRGAELDPAMKIVFITGFAAVALSNKANTPAGAKILSKPFHLRELVDEVERVMAA